MCSGDRALGLLASALTLAPSGSESLLHTRGLFLLEYL